MAKKSIGRLRAGLCFFWAFSIVFHHAPLRAKDPKMTAEELISKHLASIGTAEARAAAKNRTASGSAQVIFHMPKPGQLSGSSSILSNGKMIRFVIQFGPDDGEQLVFDGKGVDVGQIQLRVRTNLADFVHHYNVMLKEGLLCGTLTTAWPLLDIPGQQPKLDYTGLKKVDGKSLHEIKYRAKKDGGDVQVALYFNPETFRHVYSEYRLIVRAISIQGTDERGKALPDTSAQNDVFYKIQEWFDDFKPVDGLNLPHAYKLSFSRRGSSQATIFDYKIELNRILHNQAMDPNTFAIR